MEIIYELVNIENAAKEFLELTKNYKVLAFGGDLGAGKTTFISTLCKLLKVNGTISSPTYSIIQEYNTLNDEIIYHIDLYRIKSGREAMDAGIEDCLNSNEICMVEWPERVPGIFPENTVFTNIEILSASKRKLVVSS
ncbi:MAG TPA: tRNA (adenosine(37)-N6)-threonylcarbamoyltransferase complex ATPase subunit type 1 TsaE [Hanamia sp.]|nr:tRNA (adenosine(37)-N6)-threonylcarbamoyltransferase complex ATPase subunit type 1 TsaE [Hanamia sp.]